MEIPIACICGTIVLVGSPCGDCGKLAPSIENKTRTENPSGVGTIFAEIVGEQNCSCKSTIAEMDLRGPQGCRDSVGLIDEIVANLRDSDLTQEQIAAALTEAIARSESAANRLNASNDLNPSDVD